MPQFFYYLEHSLKIIGIRNEVNDNLLDNKQRCRRHF